MGSGLAGPQIYTQRVIAGGLLRGAQKGRLRAPGRRDIHVAIGDEDMDCTCIFEMDGL